MKESSQDSTSKTQKIKKMRCIQKDCLSGNLDSLELVVLETKGAKKKGLMCSQCLLDSELLQQLTPIQLHVLPIRKFIQLLTYQYQFFNEQRKQPSWGPTQVREQKEAAMKQISQLQTETITALLEIEAFVASLAKSTLLRLKQINHDADLKGIMDLTKCKNDSQIEKKTLKEELMGLCQRVRMVQGRPKLLSDDKMNHQIQLAVDNYRANMNIAAKTFEALIANQQACLHSLTQLLH